jgi:C1A family cysteine protease
MKKTFRWKCQNITRLGIAAMLMLGALPQVHAQVSSTDITQMRNEIAKRKYSFTVDRNTATEIPLSQLCGTLPTAAPQTPNTLSLETAAVQATLPASWDWRQHGGVTPVKNQASCGGCWAFSTIGTAEAMILLKTGVTADLSEQELISCNNSGWSCSGGNYAFDMLVNSGAVGEGCFPYQAANVPCQSGCPYLYKLNSWGYVGNYYSVPSVSAIKNAIYTYGPISVCVAVDSYFQAYSGGVFNANTATQIDHAVMLVGWDDANGCWIMKNSWGTGWGESGYMRIAYGCDLIGYASAYAIYSTQAGNLGFEQPATGTYVYNPSGASWTFSPSSSGSGSGISANNSAFTSGNAVAPEGAQVAFLQGYGTISQTISSFTAGTSYTVKFLAAQRQNYGGHAQTFNVQIDGATIGSFAPPAGTSYLEYTTSFTATAATHMLAFVGTDLNGGDNTVFLDNVRITPASAAPPAAPTGLAAAAGNAVVNLSWVQSTGTGITGNKVYRSTTGSSGPYTLLASLTAKTAYADTTVANGSTYYYVVTAVNTHGESAYSSYSGATPKGVIQPANYSFETPTTSTYVYNPSGASWTFTALAGSNGSGITANNSAFTSKNPAAPLGVQAAFVQGTGSVSQVVSGFVSGAHYTVTFAAAQRANKSGGQAGQTWDVRVNGSTIGSFAPAQTATNYVSYSAGFTASATSHTLAFVGTNTKGGDNTIFLDKVQITSP